MDVLHQKIHPQAKIKINIKVEKPAHVKSIKGKPISGIDSIIAISSGKGGVGKSTVTANLAVTLAKMGCSVGAFRCRYIWSSMPTMFDMEGKRPLSVNVDGKSKMAPIENYGVKVLSIGFLPKPIKLSFGVVQWLLKL